MYLSMMENPKACFYQTRTHEGGHKVLMYPGQPPIVMSQVVQVKCRLLGHCAQCLLHKSEGHHMDFLWDNVESQCPNMSGQHMPHEGWKRRFGAMRWSKLHNCVGVVDGKVVLAPWLAQHAPQPQR